VLILKRENLKKVVSGITALCVMATLGVSVYAAPFQQNPTTVTGDVNGDNVVDCTDLLDLKKEVLGITNNSSNNNNQQQGGWNNWNTVTYNYDVNNDGAINVVDVMLLKDIILSSASTDDTTVTTTPSDATTVTGTVTKVGKQNLTVEINGETYKYNMNDYGIDSTAVSEGDQVEVVYTDDISNPTSVTPVGATTTEPTVTTEPDTTTEPTDPDTTTTTTTTTTDVDIEVVQDAVSFKFNSSGVTAYDENGEEVDSQMVKGTIVYITVPGEYSFEGSCDEGQIYVDVDKTTYADGAVTLNLQGLTLSNSTTSPIYVASVDDVCEISAKKGTSNVISDGTSYTNADDGVGAIYSKDDLKFKGKGTLVVNGNCEDGIVSKNDIRIWNGDITVNAVDDGIRGKDSVRIGDPDTLEANGGDGDYSNLSVTVNATNGDGIKSTNYEDEGDGKININGGTITINAYSDGIQAEQEININGGTIDITTTGTVSSSSSSSSNDQFGGGWNNNNWGSTSSGTSSDVSAKGIKTALDDSSTLSVTPTINITGGTITIDSTDDSIHSNGDVNITGGDFTLTTGDDGIHADGTVTIGTTGGALDELNIYIVDCYEGVEGSTINQNAGTVIVNSQDDGYNAAGGSDGSGNQGGGGFTQGGWSSSGSYAMNLNGGFVLVNANDGDHDGFDSNGTITISGGYYISNGNDPFDSDGTQTFTGGVFVEDTGSSSGGGGMSGGSLSSNVSASGSASVGDVITLADSSGNVIVSFVADKSVTSIVAGCKDYSDVVVYVGGTISGATYLGNDSTQQCTVTGTITGGTQMSGSSSSSSSSNSNNPWNRN
jgi:hypothetical protein